jgi:myo-inositol-1(or 4)-monophosphatase
MSQKTNKDFLKIAESAVLKGGEVLLKYYNKLGSFDVKTGAGIVTKADKESESVICEYLCKQTPDFSILSEEEGLTQKGSSKWILDPLDGTTNFFHGFPYFSISLGLEIDNEIVVGVVYDPLHKELYKAIKHGGAYKNKKRLHVSKTEKLQNSMLGTGFAYMKNKIFDDNLRIFRTLSMKSHGIRRPGSAAIDLCYVACGIYDGFFEQTLNVWDIAAGTLIITEAGGKVSLYDGAPFCVYDKEILASNNLIHQQMVDAICRRD